MFDILTGLCLDKFLKRIAYDLLNKQNATFHKVVDTEGLMECIRGDPVISVVIIICFSASDSFVL